MSDDDYVTGYKKPPKHTQFQPGQSGNPNGRPKGTKNLATDLDEELSEKILVTEGGKQRETTTQRAMLKSLVAKALKGDTRAASVLINLTLGLEQAKSARYDSDTLGEDDRDILEAFKEELMNDAKSEKGGNSS